jgi:DNA-directed RNA polymerase I, II, and III subunit RPABC2
LRKDSVNIQSEADKNESDKVIIYKTYDADVEFRLKEIPSKNNEILIGPVRLTRFEKARITGARSLQLSLGAPILTKLPPEFTDTIMIAKYELEKKTLPISIRRILPNGLYQDIPIEWTI